MNLYRFYSSGGVDAVDTDEDYRLYKVTSPWTDSGSGSVTWNNQPNYSGESPTNSPDNDWPEPLEFPIRLIVQAIVDSNDDYGISLKMTYENQGEDDEYFFLYSRETNNPPELYVEWQE